MPEPEPVAVTVVDDTLIEKRLDHQVFIGAMQTSMIRATSA